MRTQTGLNRLAKGPRFPRMTVDRAQDNDLVPCPAFPIPIWAQARLYAWRRGHRHCGNASHPADTEGGGLSIDHQSQGQEALEQSSQQAESDWSLLSLFVDSSSSGAGNLPCRRLITYVFTGWGVFRAASQYFWGTASAEKVTHDMSV